MFRNLRKEKQLIDRDIKLYEVEQKYLVDLKIEEYRKNRQQAIESLALSCADDTKSYEHTFHSSREKLSVELAKLEAKKEYLEELIKAKLEVSDTDQAAYKIILEHKDTEIKRLNDLLSKLIDKQPITVKDTVLLGRS